MNAIGKTPHAAPPAPPVPVEMPAAAKGSTQPEPAVPSTPPGPVTDAPKDKPKAEGPSKTSRSIWRRARFGAVALAIVALVATTLWFTVLRPPLVSVAEVTRGNVTAEIEGTGTVTADVLANISSKITGRVEKVFVVEGDAVKKNQILATLDTTSLKLQVDRNRARLSGATASAKERQREWDDEKSLVGSGAVSVEESQQYQERHLVANSAVQAASSELGTAEYELSVSQIPSLSSGVVTTRWVVPGASVVPGQPMFTVADTSLIYVNASIDQSFAGKIRKGQMATVILRGREDHPLSGYVLRINPRADPATEEMAAEVAFNVTVEEFQLGQWANVYIQVGEATNALTVPRAALMPMANQFFVFVVGAKEKLRREAVTVSADSPRTPTVAIVGNLQLGDRVVLMPMGLRPGQAIRSELVKDGHGSGQVAGMGNMP